MARSINVILAANAGPYIAAMAQADAANAKFSKSTVGVGAAADKNLGKAATAATKYGKATSFITEHNGSLNTLATGMAGFGAVAAAAFGGAVTAAANFDEGMSSVKANLDATDSQMKQLRGAAIEWGQKTKYSAVEAAAGIDELGKAGVSVSDILNGGLQGALNLAAAGGQSVADAAETAASAMTQFGLSGKDIPHIADLLSAGANKAQGSVADMGKAMEYVSPVAAGMGISIEQTAGAIAEMASNGIVGQKAGTGLRGMLATLSSPTKKAADEMSKLGINVYDSSGKFVGFDGVAGQLQQTMSGLTAQERDHALGVIFGNEQLTAARVLYKGGAAAVQDWTKKVDDSGNASRTASTKMDNLKGDLEQLRGAFETALIGAGEGQQAPLRELAQSLTDIVNKWNDLSDAAKSNITKIVGAFALIGLGGAATIKVVQGVAAMKVALVDLGVVGKLTGVQIAAGANTGAAAMGHLAATAGAITAALGLAVATAEVADKTGVGMDKLIIKSDKATTAMQGLATSSDKSGKGLDGLFKNITAYGDVLPGAQANVDGFGDALNRIFKPDNWEKANDKIDGLSQHLGGAEGQLTVLKAQFGQFDTALTQMATSGASDDAAAAFTKIADAAKKQGISTTQLMTLFPEYKRQLQDQATTLGVTNLTAQDYADWMGGKIPKAVQDASNAIIANSKATDKQKEAASGASTEAQNLNAKTQSLKDTLEAMGTKTDGLSEKNDVLAAAYKTVVTQTDKLLDNFSVLKNGAVDQETANQNWAAALHNLQKAVKDNGASLDISTEKGRANRSEIVSGIGALNEKITAEFKNEVQSKGLSKATADTSKKLQQQKQDFIDAAVKAGFNRDEVHKMVDQMVKTPKELKTDVKAYGIDDLKKQIKDLQKQIDDLKNGGRAHVVKIDYKVLASGKEIRLTQTKSDGTKTSGQPYLNGGGGFATGGYVSGPGTGTSDSINARLSNGEFVIREKSVRRLGVDRLNYLNQMGDVPKFRDGGLVNTGGLNTGGNGALGPAAVPVIHMDASSIAGAVGDLIGRVMNATETVNQAAISYLEGAITPEGGGGLIGAGSFAKALDFAKSQAGKPYVWAAAGPGGYDCSGFMGAIQNVIEGKSPYSRRWSTMAFNGQDQAQGFTKNADSAFKIGVTNAGVGHTAGTINGVNVESRGGAGVIVGPKARGWNDSLFPMHYGLTSGMPGKKGIDGTFAGGGGGEPGEGSIQSYVQSQMSKRWDSSNWSSLKMLVQNESGWNPYARNASSGAYGLFQALPASKIDRFGNRNSVSAQTAFGLDYINSRYGSPASAYAAWLGRSPHWYADGGHVSGPGGPRDDKIPAMLSNGEFVVNAAATARHRELLSLINSGSLPAFATGGQVGTAAFGSSSSFSVAAIVKLIRALDNPVGELKKFTASVKAAQAANTAATKALKAPKANLSAANKNVTSAKDNLADVRDANAKALRAARAARDALTLANKKTVAGLDADTAKATKTVNARKDDLTAAKLALQKLTPATSKAASAQRALSSAITSRDSKARANAEQIAKYNDKINAAKKGTVAYQNLINSKELAQKANAREISAANDKIAKAKKAAEKAGANTGKVEAAQLKVKKAQQAVDKAQDKLDAARAAKSVKSTANSLKATQATNKVNAVTRANQASLAKAQAKVTSAQNAQKKAQDQYNAALDKSKAKSDAYKQAQEDLKQAQQAMADAVRSTSEAFQDLYTKLDAGSIADVLNSMKSGTTDLLKFTQQVDKLRKSGLNESTLQDIIDTAQASGVTAGASLAQQILSGGKGTIKGLNDAAKKLQDAADVLGYKANTGVVRKASGGFITGSGTGTSDSIHALLSNGEYVVNAKATAANRGALDMINYGVKGRMRYATGGYVQRSAGFDKSDLVNAVSGMRFYIQDPWGSDYKEARVAHIADSRMELTFGQAQRGF